MSTLPLEGLPLEDSTINKPFGNCFFMDAGGTSNASSAGDASSSASSSANAGSSVNSNAGSSANSSGGAGGGGGYDVDGNPVSHFSPWGTSSEAQSCDPGHRSRDANSKPPVFNPTGFPKTQSANFPRTESEKSVTLAYKVLPKSVSDSLGKYK